MIAESSLSKVERLHYLKTSVKGDAEQLIKNLPATEDNFDLAWDALTSRLREHTTPAEILSDRLHFTAKDEGSVTGGFITAYSRPSARWRASIVQSRTAPTSLSTWWLSSWTVESVASGRVHLANPPSPPSYDELRDFMQEQMMTLDILQSVNAESSGKPSEKSNRSARSSHVGSKGPDPGRSCPLCKRDHFIAYCDPYKRKTPQEKREAIGTHQRCWNCLGRHLLGECSSVKVCGKCSGHHHDLTRCLHRRRRTRGWAKYIRCSALRQAFVHQ